MLTKMQLFRYLLEIAFYLPVPWKLKKEILRKIKHSIESYIFDGDYISYRQIRSRFGDPQQIAIACLSEMTTEEVLEKVKRKQFIVRTLLAMVIVVMILWAIYQARALVDFWYDMNGYEIVEIVDVTRYEIK